MSYSIPDEVLLMRRVAREFARDYLAPLSLVVERSGGEFPQEAIDEMAKAGLTGLDIPQEYGGQGLSAFASAIVLEEVAAGWFSAASYASPIGAGPILDAASEELKRRWLPGIAKGTTHVAFALTEPSGGSDARNLDTKVVLVDGGFLLSGTKIFITNAHRASAMLVFARTEGKGGGVTCLLVERETEGLQIGQRFRTMAHGANPIWEVSFNECFVPQGNLIGPVGAGFEYMRSGFARTRALYGAKAVGVAQAALDYSAAYAQQRVQFGAALARHQAIRFKLAEMLAAVESCRAVTLKAASLVDRGHADAPYAAAVAKLQAARMAMQVTSDAIQIMGGHGLTMDHPLERYHREAKLFQIGDGSDEVLCMLISKFANGLASQSLRVALPD